MNSGLRTSARWARIHVSDLWFLPSMLLALISSSTVACAQWVNFQKQAGTLPGTPLHSWLTKAVADMDGDGLDDIVRLSINGSAAMLRQQAGGAWQLFTLPSLNTPPLSTVVADVTNDGRPDIFASGVNYLPEEVSYIRHYRSTTSTGTYQVSQLVDSGVGFYIQAANAVDMDRDGHLDYFACNDIGLSRIWRGTANGFVAANTLINMATTPSSDNSGNYGSIWTDVNGDGRMDLYLAKCSAYAPSDPTDPRRVNTLFINGGNGTFPEEASARGLADGSQSWCADFADIDNDGDMDCFIANHYTPSKLMLNQGSGTFTEITSSAGITATAGPLQCLFRDFDNDGRIDLLVTGNEHKLFRNNGDLTFTALSNPFPGATIPVRSFAAGDLNHDGFVDLYASTYAGESVPQADAVWLNGNAGNGNHFLSIRLFGKTGNVNAVGARVTVVDSTGRSQVREVRAGESYGISNSLTVPFGLGSASSVTSVQILWPDGATQTLGSLAMDQWHDVVQPRTDTPILSVATLTSNSITMAAKSLTPLQEYSFQSSSDLTQWTTLHSFTPLGTEHQLSANVNTTMNRKFFYRLLWN